MCRPSACERHLALVRSAVEVESGKNLSAILSQSIVLINQNVTPCRLHMICPVELDMKMFAFPTVRVGDHAEQGLLLEDR